MSPLQNSPSSVLGETPVEENDLITYISPCLKGGNAWGNSNPNPVYFESFFLGIRVIPPIWKRLTNFLKKGTYYQYKLYFVRLFHFIHSLIDTNLILLMVMYIHEMLMKLRINIYWVHIYAFIFIKIIILI